MTEWKLVYESRKILEAPDMDIEPTCVRVPVVTGHGMAASAWFGRILDAAEAAECSTTPLAGQGARQPAYADRTRSLAQPC